MPSNSLKQLHYAHTQNRIDVARTRRPYRIGLPFAPSNGDFGPFFVTKRICAAPNSKAERHI